jgi:hypothetical protein
MPQPRFELGTDFGTGLRLAFPCCGTENGSYEPKMTDAAACSNGRFSRHAIQIALIPFEWAITVTKAI